MVFVLKRTPAFQLFGPFEDRVAASIWITQHANERRHACCILEPLDSPEGQVKQGQRRLKRRLMLPASALD
jgi:hypothetical protein